jgi:putative transcriptional regulator
MKNQVRSLREEKQWSQKELALRVGVSPHCINAIERQRFPPSVQLAYEIAAAFDRPVTDVFLPQAVPTVTPSEATKSGPLSLPELMESDKSPSTGQDRRSP